MKKKKLDESHADAEEVAKEAAYMSDPDLYMSDSHVAYNPMGLKMDETEELRNAEAPRPVWETRNKYLHIKNEKLTKELQTVRRDNKRLSQANSDMLERLRKAGL
jgi:hypothetical protein